MSQLLYLNLRQNGLSDEEAKARIAEGATAPAPKEEKAKTPTAAEKKAIITKELEELGAEIPDAGASVAKFEQALASAKATPEETGL